MRPHVTIGVAGHIDHGKTTLTKALTNIETDRLIEEKKRKISIENGYAFLDLEDGWRAAVIDVPGHERFIRQMIAGVAGIDLVLLVIAADEGVMPQTQEHLDILRLLGIPAAMVVITKTSQVDDDFLLLVEEDIRQVLKGTDYENAPFYSVDSVIGTGIPELKMAITNFAKSMKGRSGEAPLRLPIDDVFTIHGHGTVVRGTIFNGSISTDSELKILPQDKNVRIKQLQVHHDLVQKAVAGQRTAVNIAGVDYKEVKRGDVLVSSDLYKPTQRLDVILRGLESVEKPLKQRAPVMVHIATSSVQGRLILFDRNRWEPGETIYGQLELDEHVVATKGDRFIVRRPTPVETLGGGEVLNPAAIKHRFGAETIRDIETIAKGTPDEWVEKALMIDSVLTVEELVQKTNLKEDELDAVLTSLTDKNVVQLISPGAYTLTEVLERVANKMLAELKTFHEEHPLRSGMNLAEWLHVHEDASKMLKEAAYHHLLDMGKIVITQHLVRLADFKPHYPEKWAKRLKAAEKTLEDQGLQPETWSSILEGSQLPDPLALDFRRYLIDTGITFPLGEDRLIHSEQFKSAVAALKGKTNDQFTVQEAKEILGLSRKHLIPLLELCDQLHLTKREDNVRVWQ